MKIAVIIVCIILLSLLDYLFINWKHILGENKKVNIKAILPSGWKQSIVYLLIPLSLACIAVMYFGFYDCALILTLKRISVIAILWPIAISDFKEYRIPNKLLLYGLLLRFLLLIAELTTDLRLTLTTLANEGIALVFVTIICIGCMLLSRGSLGMGDLKLAMCMSIFLGIEGMCYTMFVSVFFSAFIAIGLLITKKKSRKDALPFAPFILTGSFVGLILTGV